MRHAIPLLLVLLSVGGVSADESFQALFDRANRHFESGDMDSARSIYETIVRQGCVNAAVYYNLGNCYLHKGDIGHAVAMFLRAERISPRDADIRANLLLARSMIGQPVEPPKVNRFIGWIQRVHHALSTSELVFSALAAYFLTIAAFLAAMIDNRRRSRRRYIRIAVFGAIWMAIGVIGLGIRVYDREGVETAVAVRNEVSARTGPGEHFAEVYRQQAGYEMRVLRHQGGWAEVRLLNGFTGWVPDDSIERL